MDICKIYNCYSGLRNLALLPMAKLEFDVSRQGIIGCAAIELGKSFL
jgi:hypothetical protein